MKTVQIDFAGHVLASFELVDNEVRCIMATGPDGLAINGAAILMRVEDVTVVPQLSSDILIATVNDWWAGWHKSANEGDDPPKHIREIIGYLNDCGNEFNLINGQWSFMGVKFKLRDPTHPSNF